MNLSTNKTADWAVYWGVYFEGARTVENTVSDEVFDTVAVFADTDLMDPTLGDFIAGVFEDDADYREDPAVVFRPAPNHPSLDNFLSNLDGEP